MTADPAVKWFIGSKHPHYGRVEAIGIREGESWRMFLKDGVVSLIPLSVLELEAGQR